MPVAASMPPQNEMGVVVWTSWPDAVPGTRTVGSLIMARAGSCWLLSTYGQC